MKKTIVIFWATLSIAIPNSVVDRSTTAFCGTYNYAVNAQQGETPIQFTQRMIATFIRQVVVSYEAQNTENAAKQQQITTTTSDTSGIQ